MMKTSMSHYFVPCQTFLRKEILTQVHLCSWLNKSTVTGDGMSLAKYKPDGLFGFIILLLRASFLAQLLSCFPAE